MDDPKTIRAVDLVQLIHTMGHRCALVGGLAVSVRTRPRLTQDIDVVVSVTSDVEAERVGFLLASAGYTLRHTLENRVDSTISMLRFNHPLDPSDAHEPTAVLPGVDHRFLAA